MAPAARLPGAVGGLVSPPGRVENVPARDVPEMLPAASRALITIVYWVAGVSPVSVVELVGDCLISVSAVPSRRYRLYPTTPTLSVDGVHVASALVDVMLENIGGPGMVGGSPPPVGNTVTVPERFERLPAASRAYTA